MIWLQRREFITLLGGATAWPLATWAQQPTPPIVGFLHTGSAATRRHLVSAFRGGLEETGYVEGRNVAVEYRWADDQKDRLPALVADLVARRVTVIALQESQPYLQPELRLLGFRLSFCWVTIPQSWVW